MSSQPPFTITTEIIDFISAISEQVGFVQRDFLDASVNAPVNLMSMHTDQVNDYVYGQVASSVRWVFRTIVADGKSHKTRNKSDAPMRLRHVSNRQ